MSTNSTLLRADVAAARKLMAEAIGVDSHIDTIQRVMMGDDLGKRHPERRTYSSRASFDDPDGNHWIMQEVTARLPGLVDPGATSFGSVSDLAGAMRRAAVAHGEHEKRIGQKDANWPDWYAAYIVAEASGAKLPE
jgi:hypothetical protein